MANSNSVIKAISLIFAYFLSPAGLVVGLLASPSYPYLGFFLLLMVPILAVLFSAVYSDDKMMSLWQFPMWALGWALWGHQGILIRFPDLEGLSAPPIWIASAFMLMIEWFFYTILSIPHPINNTTYYALFHSALWGTISILTKGVLNFAEGVLSTASGVLDTAYGVLRLQEGLVNHFGGQEVGVAQGLTVPVADEVASAEGQHGTEANQSLPPPYTSFLRTKEDCSMV